jgi:hypothetical protein
MIAPDEETDPRPLPPQGAARGEVVMTQAGNKVMILSRILNRLSYILPGTNIGDGAVIKGGSVVTRRVPPQTLSGAADARPLAAVNVPLTADHTYASFIRELIHTTSPIPRTEKETR